MGDCCGSCVLLLVVEVDVVVAVTVLILPTSLHGVFVAVVLESKDIDDDDDDEIMGFQNRIIESEQPTANNDPDAFQHTFLAWNRICCCCCCCCKVLLLGLILGLVTTQSIH